MKVNVEIECTPEEARRAVGLPDLTPIHDRYIAMALETMSGGLKPETIEQLVKGWSPMGEAGLTLWRKLVDAGLSQSGLGGSTTGSGKDGS